VFIDDLVLLFITVHMWCMLLASAKNMVIDGALIIVNERLTLKISRGHRKW